MKHGKGRAKTVTLVDNGRPRFCLAVHPPMDGEFLRGPTEELRHYLARAPGRAAGLVS